MKYDRLTRDEAIALLVKRDATRKLGIYWERDEIEHDRALNQDFIGMAPDGELSVAAAQGGNRNLIIEGDNFDALRWLRMTHKGRVKCIYIDPPYNTGSRDWVYNDRYMDKDHRLKDSAWLEFLYRRMLLARSLLREDGVLLVSINDDNRAKLELMLEDALPGMRIGSFVWRSRIGGNDGGGAFFSADHEHILIFARPDFRFGGTEKSFEMYANPDGDPRGDWRVDNLTVAVRYDDRRAGNAYYPLHNPKTDTWYPCNPNAVWRYASRSRLKPGQRTKTACMEDFVEQGKILFPKDQRVHRWDSLDELMAAIDAGDVPTSAGVPLLRRGLPDLEFWVGRRVGWGIPAFKRHKRDLRFPKQPLSSWIKPRSDRTTPDDPERTTLTTPFTDEGTKVTRGQKLAEWDPYTIPIITEREGIAHYVDLVEGVSVREVVDETTGIAAKVVVDWRQQPRGDLLKPRVTLRDENGEVVRLPNGLEARYFMSVDAILSVENGAHVKAGDVLARIPRESSKTRDITGGLPRVAELFEARRPKDYAIISEIDEIKRMINALIHRLTT